MKLNPYKIVWTVELLNSGKVEFNHFLSKQRLEETFKPKIGSKVYIITDKQFGMIQNTWNGTTPKTLKPFTHSILIEEGKMKRLISLSKKQFNEAKQY